MGLDQPIALGALVILGIDPGALPGFALLRSADPSAGLVYVGREPPELGRHGHFTAIVERPELRPVPPGVRRKINPNAIVTLAFTAGEIAGRIAARADCVSMSAIAPRTWKGQVAKAAMLNRIRSRYHECELGLSDDEIDAIGIAAFGFGIDWVRGPW